MNWPQASWSEAARTHVALPVGPSAPEHKYLVSQRRTICFGKGSRGEGGPEENIECPEHPSLSSTAAQLDPGACKDNLIVSERFMPPMYHGIIAYCMDGYRKVPQTKAKHVDTKHMENKHCTIPHSESLV